MEERVHPIPFRTRQLSSPSSMILRTLTWESRTTPRLYFQKPFRLAREGFCFAQGQPKKSPLLKKGLSPIPLSQRFPPLSNPLSSISLPKRKRHAVKPPFSIFPQAVARGEWRRGLSLQLPCPVSLPLFSGPAPPSSFRALCLEDGSVRRFSSFNEKEHAAPASCPPYSPEERFDTVKTL